MCFHYAKTLILRESHQVAKKTHRCYECGGEILKGQEYKRTVAIVEDSDFVNVPMCESCEILAEKISKIEVSHGCLYNESFPPWGELLECAREYGLLPPMWEEQSI